MRLGGIEPPPAVPKTATLSVKLKARVVYIYYTLIMIFFVTYLLLILIILAVFIFITAYTSSLSYSLVKGSPYVATEKKLIEEILDQVNFEKGVVFMELGCGDGRVVRKAVEKYQVKGIGIDVNPLLIIWARFLGRKFSSKIFFKRKNIFDVNLQEANYLYLFLMPKLIEKLTPKMEKELKKGTIVISHGFPVKRWEKKLYKKLNQSPFPTYYYIV